MKHQAVATIPYNKSVDVASMPDRIRRLPVSPTGYPVPWFVEWFKDGEPCKTGEGEPDFRVIDPRKLAKAVRQHLCWVCGETMGIHKCFVIGPMCAINRVISEPPSHRDCAIWSARVCPFLSKPKMVRNEKGMYDENGKLRDGLGEAAGFGLKRNPGAVCVWSTKTYQPFKPEGGGVLFSLGLPTEVMWFAEGRRATRKEVMASIDSGYPTLLDLARQEGDAALAALATQREMAMALVPDA
jgi:hypothetical protein